MNSNITYKGVIYIYTFPNGKVYIGQTRRDPMIRHREHLSPTTGPSNSAFWAAFMEQGEPKFEIVEEWQNPDIDELAKILNRAEERLICLYDSTNPQKGYNLKLVGEHNSKKEARLWGLAQYFASEYLKDLMPVFNSVVKKLHHVDRMTEEERQLYARCFGDDNMFHGTCDAQSDDADFWEGEEIEYAQFILEEDMRIKAEDYVHENAVVLLEGLCDEHTIYQLDDDGNIIAKYDSQNEAAIAMNAKTSANINNVLRGKQLRAYGYRWVYAIDYHEHMK